MSALDISLYGILDPERSLGRDLAQLADQAVAGGCTLLQLRDKQGSTRQILARARSIMEAVGGRVPVLINDRVDVAMAAGTDGVHLGQDDMPIDAARDLLGPRAIIGLSIKTSTEASSFPQAGLDYVCVGGVFDTSSKDNATSIGIDGWKALATQCRARGEVAMPVGAIAGIDVPRTSDLIKAGADGVAIISALFMQEDVKQATQQFHAAIEGARGQ